MSKYIPKRSKYEIAIFREDLTIKFMTAFIAEGQPVEHSYLGSQKAVDFFMRTYPIGLEEVEKDCNCNKKLRVIPDTKKRVPLTDLPNSKKLGRQAYKAKPTTPVWVSIVMGLIFCYGVVHLLIYLYSSFKSVITNYF